MAVVSEWVEWHRGYEDASGSLARRLAAVREQIRDALDRCPPGEIRAVSMCAGDGRDLLGVLSAHPRRRDVRARLVEQDPDLVARGQARAVDAPAELVIGDASTTTAYEGAVPADVVLACGIFGNISDEDHRIGGGAPSGGGAPPVRAGGADVHLPGPGAATLHAGARRELRRPQWSAAPATRGRLRRSL